MLSKKSLRVFALLAAFITTFPAVVALGVWINNVSVAYQSYKTGAENVVGIFPSFDWMAVDITTISTAIPALGLIFIVVGLFRMVDRRDGPAPEQFPFPKGYGTWNGSLGFIGTLVGLVIAVRAVVTLLLGIAESGEAMTADLGLWKVLFSGIEAALWSSVSAFAWVILVSPPVRFVMRRWYAASSEINVGEDPDVADGAVALAEELARTSEALSEFRENIRGNGRMIRSFLNTIPQLESVVEQLLARSEASNREQRARDRELKNLADVVAAMQATQQKLQSSVDDRNKYWARSLRELLRLTEDQFASLGQVNKRLTANSRRNGSASN